MTFNYSSFWKYSFLKAVFEILLILEANVFVSDIFEDSQSATHLVSEADVILVIVFLDFLFFIQILRQDNPTHFRVITNSESAKEVVDGRCRLSNKVLLFAGKLAIAVLLGQGKKSFTDFVGSLLSVHHYVDHVAPILGVKVVRLVH